MLAEIGNKVLVCDLDPQANLTSAFLQEEALEALWPDQDEPPTGPDTMYRCIQPLTRVGDIQDPNLKIISENLALLPGDLALSGFEDKLSSEWPNSLGGSDLYRAFRVLTAFWQVAQKGADCFSAKYVLVDVGPNLGAINRSVMIGSDFVVVPLGADLFSLQGLRNLGPTLNRWRKEWGKRLENYPNPEFQLPRGEMKPLGYVVQQHLVRQNRPIQAFDRWVNRIPHEYRKSILEEPDAQTGLRPEADPHCLATLRHYRSLVPMGQEARKPIFALTASDGAIGSHAKAVHDARKDFQSLAEAIIERVGQNLSPG